jgi:putative FmdB family regulatory protein
MEVRMPRYEFYCDDCKKPFELILTLAEYEKGKVKCPKCGKERVHQEAATFFAVTSKKS